MAHLVNVVARARQRSKSFGLVLLLIVGSGSASSDPMVTFNDLTESITVSATGFMATAITCGIVGTEICTGTVTTLGTNMANTAIQVNLFQDQALTKISDVISIVATAGQKTERVCFESD